VVDNFIVSFAIDQVTADKVPGGPRTVNGRVDCSDNPAFFLFFFGISDDILAYVGALANAKCRAPNAKLQFQVQHAGAA